MAFTNRSNKLSSLLGVCFILITVIMAIKKSRLGWSNTYFTWGIYLLTISTCFNYAYKSKLLIKWQYLTVTSFLAWSIIGFIRGLLFEVSNYWLFKQSLIGFFAVLTPAIVFVANKPNNVLYIIRIWCTWFTYLYVLFFSWLSFRGSGHFYLGHVLTILLPFFVFLPSKWRIITLGITIYLASDLNARSQVIKAVVGIIFAIAFSLKRFIPSLIIHIGTIATYLLTFLLLYLGLTGQYNIFDHTEHRDGPPTITYSQEGYSEQDGQNELLIDTRTFIYLEVINSALENNYVIFGRTLARGNDSLTFGKNSLTGYEERYGNEICHTSVFTWLGLIGVILFSFIYFISSFLSAFRSNNIYMKILALLVAFHWMYGWVEDILQFDAMYIAIWMIMGMCLSPSFRKMTDKEFEIWAKAIFHNTQTNNYEIYQFVKKLAVIHLLKKRIP